MSKSSLRQKLKQLHNWRKYELCEKKSDRYKTKK